MFALGGDDLESLPIVETELMVWSTDWRVRRTAPHQLARAVFGFGVLCATHTSGSGAQQHTRLANK